MFSQIVSFLLDVAATLIGGACLLRLYMSWLRLSMVNPLGQFVQAVSDWLVLPLRRIVPPGKRFDSASLLAAWLIKLVEFAVLLLLFSGTAWALLPLTALFGVARLAISVATAVVIIAVVLSWVPSNRAMDDMFKRLTEPLLAPLRRVIPLVGGIDLSPLALLVLLQIGSIVLTKAQASLLGGSAAVAMLG